MRCPHRSTSERRSRTQIRGAEGEEGCRQAGKAPVGADGAVVTA